MTILLLALSYISFLIICHLPPIFYVTSCQLPLSYTSSYEFFISPAILHPATFLILPVSHIVTWLLYPLLYPYILLRSPILSHFPFLISYLTSCHLPPKSCLISCHLHLIPDLRQLYMTKSFHIRHYPVVLKSP